MVKNNLFIKLAVMLFFLVLLVSAMPEEYIDSTLSSIVYSGRNRSERGGNKVSIREGAVFDEFDEVVLSQFTNLPILVGMDINRSVDYIATYGYGTKIQLHLRDEKIPFKFTNINMGVFSALKVSFASSDNLQNLSTGYYSHYAQRINGSFLFHFSLIYSISAPYYQEIKQRAKPTPNILPNQKGNQPIIKGENITFYHLDRNDGYIETYGFRKPKGNELKGVEQILVLQAIYPAAQMAKLAGPLKELFVQEVQQHQAVWGY